MIEPKTETKGFLFIQKKGLTITYFCSKKTGTLNWLRNRGEQCIRRWTWVRSRGGIQYSFDTSETNCRGGLVQLYFILATGTLNLRLTGHSLQVKIEDNWHTGSRWVSWKDSETTKQILYPYGWGENVRPTFLPYFNRNVPWISLRTVLYREVVNTKGMTDGGK